MELQVVFDNFPKTTLPRASWLDQMTQCLSHLGIQSLVVFKFVSDDEMLDQNRTFLNHDTFTDILTFDLRDTLANEVNILISTDRVADNAQAFQVSFEKELFRVMCHGLLHVSGFGDKTDEESLEMRKREDELIDMFHVEP